MKITLIEQIQDCARQRLKEKNYLPAGELQMEGFIHLGDELIRAEEAVEPIFQRSIRSGAFSLTDMSPDNRDDELAALSTALAEIWGKYIVLAGRYMPESIGKQV